MFSFLKTFRKNIKDGHFFFIHIPKTAGTSFITLLDTCVDETHIFPCQLWQEISEEIVAKKAQYKLLRGHFGGGSYHLLCDQTPHCLTILRNPISLSISTYHFIKREKNTAVHHLVKDKNMSLRAFLEEPLTAHKIDNRMVRHLSFDLQKDPEAQELFLSPQSVKVVSKWIKTPKKINNKQRLLRAKKAIDKCSWFGIMEKFDESMQLFAYTFKRPPMGQSAKLNTFKKPDKIDSYCENLINNHNEFDNELYQYALIKFKQKYQAMLEDLQVNSNKFIDEKIDQHYKKFSQQEVTNQVDYDFGKQLLGGGWHRREITQPENTFFRWTARSDSFIDFWLEPRNYTLKIRIINTISLEHLQNLTIYINNHTIDYQYDTEIGVVRILQAKVKAELIENNLLRIQFKQNSLKQHAQVFQSDDTRYLGLAINWIKILPCQSQT